MEQIILNNKNGSTEIYYKLFSMLSLLTFIRSHPLKRKRKTLSFPLKTN